MPDARDRLKYVATMTEQAAERVLNAIELAKPMQEAMQRDAQALDARWERVVRGADRAGRGARADRRHARLPAAACRRATQATNAQLLEIMLAQDFQDLTGQVIKKITDVVYLIEQQLLGVLLENIAPERREQFAAIGGGADVVGERQPGDICSTGRRSIRKAGPMWCRISRKSTICSPASGSDAAGASSLSPPRADSPRLRA